MFVDAHNRFFDHAAASTTWSPTTDVTESPIASTSPDPGS
jgi:hypothetical protein